MHWCIWHSRLPANHSAGCSCATQTSQRSCPSQGLVGLDDVTAKCKPGQRRQELERKSANRMGPFFVTYSSSEDPHPPANLRWQLLVSIMKSKYWRGHSKSCTDFAREVLLKGQEQQRTGTPSTRAGRSKKILMAPDCCCDRTWNPGSDLLWS